MRERDTPHYSAEQEEWENRRREEEMEARRMRGGYGGPQHRAQSGEDEAARRYPSQQGGQSPYGAGSRESYGQSRSPGSSDYQGPGGFRQQEGFQRGPEGGYGREAEGAYGRDQFGGGGYGREGWSARQEDFGGGSAPGSFEQGGGGPRGFGRGEAGATRARGEWAEGGRSYPYGEGGLERGHARPGWSEPVYGFGTPGGAPERDAWRGRKGPKGYVRSDERIREFLCERLVQYHQLDVSDVSVEVRDGEVILEGTVPERHMKYRIEDVADSCWGVKDVDNRLRVASSVGADIGGALHAGGGTLGSPGASTTPPGTASRGARPGQGGGKSGGPEQSR